MATIIQLISTKTTAQHVVVYDWLAFDEWQPSGAEDRVEYWGQMLHANPWRCWMLAKRRADHTQSL